MDNNNDELKNLYSTTEDRIDTLLTRDHADFWIAVRTAMSGMKFDSPSEIRAHLLEEFGIDLTYTEGSGAYGFLPEARIVDEQKYLIFMLKYPH